MWQAVNFSIGVTGPVFLLIFTGYILRRMEWMSESFVAEASALIFKLFLPCLLFFTIVQLDLAALFQPKLLLTLLLITLLAYLVLEGLSGVMASLRHCRGEFCQAGFRSNLAFMGLAFCAGAYPEEGVARASLLVAVLTIFYNVLSVITLERHLSDQGSGRFMAILSGVVKNPLIIGISLALILNGVQDYFPASVMNAGQRLGQLTLPLALLCVGASLSFRAGMQADQRAPLLWASAFKLLFLPWATVLTLWIMGFSGIDIGVPFLLLAAPTATASFVMVTAMGGNSRLAANLVVLTTLLSLFTVSVGLAVLHNFQLN